VPRTAQPGGQLKLLLLFAPIDGENGALPHPSDAAKNLEAIGMPKQLNVWGGRKCTTRSVDRIFSSAALTSNSESRKQDARKESLPAGRDFFRRHD
jgi:hypothetical protein